MTDVPRTVRYGTTAGAGVGILGFLLAGLVPAFHYGTHAGGLLAGGIFHDLSDPPLAYTVLVYFGAFMVVMGIASLFTVMGAVAGTALGQLTHNVVGTAAPAATAPAVEVQPAAVPPASAPAAALPEETE